MEPVRFADILFTVLVSGLTLGIIALVNRKQAGGNKEASEPAEDKQNSGSEDTFPSTGNDS